MSELPVHKLIGVLQAIAILDAAPVRSRIVSVPLPDAIGLRLARPTIADRDYPPLDKSVMDGFAVRAGDVTSAGTELVVIDTIAAGQLGQAIGPGQAAAIMTGAPLPAGADAVVPVEHTTRLGDHVRINVPAKIGNAIARRGSDTVAGRVLLERGVRVGPAQIAVAASVGATTVSVYARPVVAVLSTGDELVDIDQAPTGSQIRNSNSLMLVALLRQLGCDVRHVAHVRDQMSDVLAAITANLHHDALFITGGMSMGEFDFVPKALRQLGATFEIAKLRIKPGKPFVYTRLANPHTGWRLEPPPVAAEAATPVGDSHTCHIFGLPGNPVSAYVCTVRLAARILARIAGGPPDPKLALAALTTPLPANGPREFYLPAILTGTEVTPLNPNGSADIFTLVRANVLLIRPENAAAALAGDQVTVLEIN